MLSPRTASDENSIIRIRLPWTSGSGAELSQRKRGNSASKNSSMVEKCHLARSETCPHDIAEAAIVWCMESLRRFAFVHERGLQSQRSWVQTHRSEYRTTPRIRLGPWCRCVLEQGCAAKQNVAAVFSQIKLARKRGGRSFLAGLLAGARTS